MNPYIIKQPVITEKSIDLANQQNVYTFFVDLKASKPQIKSAIEELYEVEVVGINTMVTPSKRRRVGRQRRPKLDPVKKKALVKLKQGQTIELFDLGGGQ